MLAFLEKTASVDSRFGEQMLLGIIGEDMSFEIVVDVIQIIFADIVLSGDNALVIGMAAAGLSAKLRKRAIFIGMALAAGLRILFAITATYLLAIKGILLVGAALLWVVVQPILDRFDHIVREGVERVQA